MSSEKLLREAAEAERIAAEAERLASEKEGDAERLLAEARELRALANQKRAQATAALNSATNGPTDIPFVERPAVPAGTRSTGGARSSVVVNNSDTNKGLIAVVVGVVLALLLFTWLSYNNSQTNTAVSGVAATAKEAKETAFRALGLAEGADKKAAAADTKSDKALQTSQEAAALADKCDCDKDQKPAPKKRQPKSPVAATPALQAPVGPQAPIAGLKHGGCIATSDGTAILINDPAGTLQPSGKELARIPNALLVQKYPDSMGSLQAHAAACKAWRTEFAQTSLKAGRVNNDSHIVH